MVLVNIVLGVCFGILAIFLYAAKFAVGIADQTTRLATGGKHGLGVLKTATSTTIKVLRGSSLFLSISNFLLALLQGLMAIVLVFAFLSPMTVASTILKTGGSADTAKAQTATTQQVADNKAASDGNATDQQKKLMDFAKSFVGKVPYVWGGSTTKGWDCSGFTLYAFKNALGINLGTHNDASQAATAKSWGAADDPKNPKPGDLMRFPGHVAIYLGNGMLVEAADPQHGTRITKVYPQAWEYYDIIDHHK